MNVESQLLVVIRQFLIELGRDLALNLLSVDASLEKDLGIGSLEKIELLARIEQAFDRQFPTLALARLTTPNDIVAIIQQTHSLENPSQVVTLIDTLLKYAREEPDRPHLHLETEGEVEQTICYGQLYEEAQTIAKGFYAKGLKAGETVAMMLPVSSDFFSVFWGIWLAGGIPILIKQVSDVILNGAKAKFLVVSEKIDSWQRNLMETISSLEDVTTVKALRTCSATMPYQLIKPDNIAMLQYPFENAESVMLTHGNLLAIIRAYGKTNEQPSDDIIDGALLCHDIGLIRNWLGNFYYGTPVVIRLNYHMQIYHYPFPLDGQSHYPFSPCGRRCPTGRMRGENLVKSTKSTLNSRWIRIKRIPSKMLRKLYAGYFAIVFFSSIPCILLSFRYVSQKRAAAIIKYYSAFLMKLTFCQMEIDGREYLNCQSPLIFVANHASYIDSLILLAILPAGVLFVAKEEVWRTPIVGYIVKKLCYLMAHRTDTSKNIEDLQCIAKALENQKSIMIFPEGTFTEIAGLRPFKLGAFKLAAETCTAICPIVIEGTRQLLRLGCLPKRSTIKVNISKPIEVMGSDWSEMLRLHALVREKMADQYTESFLNVVAPGPLLN